MKVKKKVFHDIVNYFSPFFKLRSFAEGGGGGGGRVGETVVDVSRMNEKQSNLKLMVASWPKEINTSSTFPNIRTIHLFLVFLTVPVNAKNETVLQMYICLIQC